MALSFTKNFRMNVGSGSGRMIFVMVTHDESTSTFTAQSVDMNHIETLMHSPSKLTSSVANMSIAERYDTTYLSQETTTRLPLSIRCRLAQQQGSGWLVIIGAFTGE